MMKRPGLANTNRTAMGKSEGADGTDRLADEKDEEDEEEDKDGEAKYD